VVATNVGGVPEAVVDRQTGILVPPFDAQALSEACIALIRDPERRKALGRAGRQFVLDHYQWKANAATMAAVYGKLLSRRSGAMVSSLSADKELRREPAVAPVPPR
jgi:glycosyltransferase involved in cell wall biosynthesis